MSSHPWSLIQDATNRSGIRHHEAHVPFLMVALGLHLQVSGMNLYCCVDHGVIGAELP